MTMKYLSPVTIPTLADSFIRLRNVALRAAALLVVGFIAPALSQTHTLPSTFEDIAFFKPPDFIPAESWPAGKIFPLGRIEIALSKPAFRNIYMTLEIKRGAREPDAFALGVSYPKDGTQVFCYLSWLAKMAYREKVIEDGMPGRQARLVGQKYELIEQAADAVKRTAIGMEPDRIGSGVMRSFPEEAQRKILLAASGACNPATNRFRPGVLRTNPHDGTYGLVEIIPPPAAFPHALVRAGMSTR